MRAQSFRAASRCETAKGKVCHCRCGGRAHGRMRVAAEEDGWKSEREFFEALPEDDPHHVPSAEERRERAKRKRVEHEARGQGLLWSIFGEGEEA